MHWMVLFLTKIVSNGAQRKRFCLGASVRQDNNINAGELFVANDWDVTCHVCSRSRFVLACRCAARPLIG